MSGSSLSWNYLGLRWCAMFNIYFFIHRNFGTFFYFDVFLSNSILFPWISVHFFELLLHLILIAFTRHFKGQMKILTSMLYYKSHYPESHYQLRISNGIGTAKILFFSYKFFLEKKQGIYIRYNPIFFFFCLVIQHQYHFDAIIYFSAMSYSFIQRRPLVF